MYLLRLVFKNSLRFAIDAPTYPDIYPEYVLPSEEKKGFDRQGCIVGRKLADTRGWKVGDRIPLRGTIFPGTRALA